MPLKKHSTGEETFFPALEVKKSIIESVGSDSCVGVTDLGLKFVSPFQGPDIEWLGVSLDHSNPLLAWITLSDANFMSLSAQYVAKKLAAFSGL